MAAHSSAPSHMPVPVRPRGALLWCAILALMLTLLLEALDQTIVGTALPRIIGQLHGLDRYTWTVSAYLLASTTLIPVVGKLSDQFGRKRFLLGGTALFLLGSVLCGSAQSIDQLIVFRALQGAGGGIGIALVFTAVGDLVPPDERGRWQGIVGAVYAVSAVSGPTLGGWLADHGPLLGALVTDASRWRWVFYINLPLGLVALVTLGIFLPVQSPARAAGGETVQHSIDSPGALLAAVATLCLLLGLTWSGENTYSWSRPQVIGALAAAAVLYAVLLAVEHRAREPILPLHLFRDREFAAVAALSVLTNMALFGMAFYVPLYLQEVLGSSATQSGASMTPFSVSIAVAGTLAGFAISTLKRNRTIAVLGAVVMAAGAVCLTQLTPATSLIHVSLFVSIAGLGIGALFTVVSVVSLNAVPPAEMGAGVGAVRYLGQIGGALGSAVVGTVVNTSFASESARRIPATLVRRLEDTGVHLSSMPQLLMDPAYRAAIARTPAGAATRHSPFGATSAQTLASARQIQQMLEQLFESLRLSLAAAIQHGLTAPLLCSAGAIVAACLLKENANRSGS